MPLCVCKRGGTDVSSFDVPNYEQAFLLAQANRLLIADQTGDPENLIHGDLRFDRRNEVGNGIDDLHIKPIKSLCRRLRRFPELFQTGFQNPFGYKGKLRIQSHDDRCFLTEYCFLQSLHHCFTSSPGTLFW